MLGMTKIAWRVAWWLLKAAIAGVVSYGAPRFLVALGVPLDRWIVALAGTSPEIALWAVTLVVFTALFFADRLWHAYQNRRADRASAQSANAALLPNDPALAATRALARERLLTAAIENLPEAKANEEHAWNMLMTYVAVPEKGNSAQWKIDCPRLYYGWKAAAIRPLQAVSTRYFEEPLNELDTIPPEQNPHDHVPGESEIIDDPWTREEYRKWWRHRNKVLAAWQQLEADLQEEKRRQDAIIKSAAG